MSRLTVIVLSIAVLCVAASSFAATVAVGSCEPKLPTYSTISQAVTGAPSGSIILICPGTYPEQVTITQPLTLKGVATGTSSAAVIALPATLQVLQTNVGSFVPQILVQSAGGNVIIEDLIVDGTDVPNQTFNFIAGIYYLDSSGTITNIAVRNQPPGGQSVYQGGAGIVLDSENAAESVTIENNAISASAFGVWMANNNDGISSTIKSNFIDGSAIGQGVRLAGTVTGTIASNSISGFTDGLEFFNTNLGVTSNTIHGGDIVVAGGSNTIEKNTIDAGGGSFGAQLYNAGSSANIVEYNTILNSTTAAIYGCFDPILGLPGATGNTVSNNTILNAGVGIMIEASNTSATNKFNFVSTATQTCPD